MDQCQLQGLIEECQRLSCQVEDLEERRKKQGERQKQLLRLCRERRMEIAELHYGLKQSASFNIKKGVFKKSVADLEREIKNTVALNTKIKEQYQQMTFLCKNTRKKIDHVQNKIRQAGRQIELAEKYYRNLERGELLESSYWELRSTLEHQMMISRELEEEHGTNFQRKKEELMKLQGKIDEQEQQFKIIEEKVRVQKLLIESILRMEGNSADQSQSQHIQEKKVEDVKLLDEMEEKQFAKGEELDIFQRAELQNIFNKQEFKSKEEQARMGKILRQNNRRERLGKIVSLRGRYSLTEMVDGSHIKSDLTPSQSNHFAYYSSQRLQELQKRKRVRTRQTEMKRYSRIYKNILSNSEKEAEKFENKNSRSILDVYQQMRKQPFMKRRKVGNIEIIKLMRQQNRKRMVSGLRGVPTQCQR